MNEVNTSNTSNTIIDEMKINAANTIEKLSHSFDVATDKVAETTAEMSEKAISTVKKYPLHTALVAGAVGLIAGAVISRK